jgi:hypothetical protein
MIPRTALLYGLTLAAVALADAPWWSGSATG